MAADTLTALALFITSIGSVLTVVVSAYNAFKIHQVHKATNGLVEKLGDAREAKGFREGRADHDS